MPIIEYDLREQPHASGEKAAGYYPVAVSHNKADERKLHADISHATTLTPSDLAAALSAVAEFVARHLSQGDRVELPGIGTFSLRLGADGPIEYRDDKQLSRRLQIRGIRFLPKQELLAAVREEARFRRSGNPSHSAAELSDADVASRLASRLSASKERLLTRADIQSALGYSKTRTLRSIPGWVERGLLEKLGTPHSPYYRLNPVNDDAEQQRQPVTSAGFITPNL